MSDTYDDEVWPAWEHNDVFDELRRQTHDVCPDCDAYIVAVIASPNTDEEAHFQRCECR